MAEIKDLFIDEAGFVGCDIAMSSKEWDKLISKLLTEYRQLRSASEEILHLHMCEQEGIGSGQPTRKQWLDAVDKLSKLLYP